MSKQLPYGTIALYGVPILIVIGIFALVILGPQKGDADPASIRATRELVLSCTTDMSTVFHIHPELAIVVNGERQSLPTNIGINAGCMNPLHTHDSTGIIHVESPERKDFLLSDFFLVWGKTFTKDQILDHKADATHQIRMTVNGVDSTEFENLLLKDHDKIEIAYQEIEE